MYLKSFKLCNFRKFGDKENTINFVSSRKSFIKNDEVNLASGTTLIIGKNNSGKTTITKALDIILNHNCKFKSADFNFLYLNSLFRDYKNQNFKVFPTMCFEFIISIDNEEEDLFTNFQFLMNIENCLKGNMEMKIILKYEVKEENEFKEKFKALMDRKNDKIHFYDFLDLIDEIEFSRIYYDEGGSKIDDNMKIENFINLKTVKANKDDLENLSVTFNEIINYKYNTGKKVKEEENNQIDSIIENINTIIDKGISEPEKNSLNDILHKIYSKNKVSINLTSNLTYGKLLKNLIKYEYIENELNIPETQFGLGYSNLMSIISKLIDYLEKYPDEKYVSKINLICVEEPEAFMHPQMQEQFINNINDAVKALLELSPKKINSQLIVTTHSSHILNSKIHSSNSFDNICYLTEKDTVSNIINLDNSLITGNYCSKSEKKEEYEARKNKDLKFLKKHIIYKVSELFFSDAIIMVEGLTEASILPFYINEDRELSKSYISILNINGAHGLVYHDLINILKIPTLIITDLDIKRSSEEKGEGKKEKNERVDFYKQIDSLSGRETTNHTIIKYNPKEKKIGQLRKSIEINNFKIVYQKEKIKNYYATSFEEAMILTNNENDCLNRVLETIKPEIYRKIVEGDRKNLILNSYKFQKKLADSKSDFANSLLYELTTMEEEIKPELPKYIQEGLKWLKKQLQI